MPDHLTRAALALDPTLKLPEPTADELADRILELSLRFLTADGNLDAYYKLRLIHHAAWGETTNHAAPPPLICDWPCEKQLQLIDLIEKALENEH